MAAAVVERAVPQLPADPTPAQVLAFARLHALASGIHPGKDKCQPEAHRPHKGYRPAVLYDGLDEAFALASAQLRAQRSPHAGEALDCFVSAHARSRTTRDAPAFRHLLSRQLAADAYIDRYWQLTAELVNSPSGPPEPTPGAAHDWLRAALDAQMARPSR